MPEREYNLYYDDEFVGTFTATELQEKIGVSSNKVPYYESERITFKKHYTFHLIYREPTVYKQNVQRFGKALLEEWDRVTAPYRNRKRNISEE